MGAFSNIKSFDIYPKTLDEFREKTASGAAISIVSLLIISLLVVSEFFYFLQIERVDQLYVDTADVGKMGIYMNVTFPSLSCEVLSIDVMDVTGDHQLDVSHSLYKTRLDKFGRPMDTAVLQKGLGEGADGSKNPEELSETAARALQAKSPDYCGSCYGAEDPTSMCCNTCDDVRAAYRRRGWAFTPSDDMEQCYAESLKRKMRTVNKEGCNIAGLLTVNKVAGNFHIAPGHSFQTAQSHVHDFMPFEMGEFNVSHVINRLGFGTDYPGLKNPLDARVKTIETGVGLYQYYIKVVPTVYEYANGKEVVTNQYSVTENFRHAEKDPSFMPGVFFMFDLSPIMVHIREQRRSFIHFFTSVCAIAGGVFTVAGLIDSILYQGLRTLKRKQEIGKLG